jgi:hypothetical protein
MILDRSLLEAVFTYANTMHNYRLSLKARLLAAENARHVLLSVLDIKWPKAAAYLRGPLTDPFSPLTPDNWTTSTDISEAAAVLVDAAIEAGKRIGENNLTPRQ